MSKSEARIVDDSDAGDLTVIAETLMATAIQAAENEDTSQISQETIQKIMVAAVKLYANKLEHTEDYFLPFPSREAVTATEVIVSAAETCRAVNLNSFDIAMWFGRPRPEGAP